jgi:parallel beta-helix repeat protein
VLGLACSFLLASVIFAPAPALAARTFNVKAFGATGNGVTNDTAALQACFTAANAVPGSSIVFPQGSYLNEGTLLVSGNGVSVVGQHATLIAGTTVALLAFNGTHESVQGMTFSSQSTLPTAVEFFDEASGFLVQNNTFNTGFETCVIVVDSSNGQILSNKMTLGDENVAVVIESSSKILVQNNVATGNSNSQFLSFGGANNISVVSNRMTGGGTVASVGSCDTVSFFHNVFSYSEAGLTVGECQNMTVSLNQMTGASTADVALEFGNCQSVLVSNNTVQGGNSGLGAGDNTNLQVSGNTINNCAEDGIELTDNTTTIVSGNTITNVGTAILSGSNIGVTLSGNQIAQCQTLGILSDGDTQAVKIANNTIRNCGLNSSNPPAVIFVDDAGASSISITHNSYTGNTSNLQFFIRCEQSAPPAVVSGNTTNTGLPTVTGP